MLFLEGSAQGLHEGRHVLDHLCLGREAGGIRESYSGTRHGFSQLHVGRRGCSGKASALVQLELDLLGRRTYKAARGMTESSAFTAVTTAQLRIDF